jgi:hypothetical protein
LGLRALQLMMGLECPALESELGRKSTDLRARKRSRAHLKRTHGALQRSLGRRLRGEKPVERRARPDRRSGAHRSAQECRKATRPAQDEPCKRLSYGGKGCGRKAVGREAAGGDTRPSRDGRAGGTTAAGRCARLGSTRRSGSAGARACGPGRRSGQRRRSRRRSSRTSQTGAVAATGLGADLPAPPSARGATVNSKTAGASPGGDGGLGFARTAHRPSRAPRRGAATGRGHARPGWQGDGRPGARSYHAPAAPAAAASGWKRTIPANGSWQSSRGRPARRRTGH